MLQELKRVPSMAIRFSCSSGTKPARILALLLVLASMIGVHGQSDPPGFVSIDCGYTKNNSYVDKVLNITYFSDSEYVESGVSYNVSAEFMSFPFEAANEQETTLRSFPNGSRNCYTLPATTNKKYLLRATFTYGNYDGLHSSQNASLFLFGLHIGVNIWEEVNLTTLQSPSDTIWKEVLTIAPSNFISVCLINMGKGTPFVSTLDLRQVEDTMYRFVNASVSVSYFKRFRFGKVADSITRYPTDRYDRFWESFINSSALWRSLNTTQEVGLIPAAEDFKVPSVILQKASSIQTNSSDLTINVRTGPNMDPTKLALLPIFHFAEIENNSPNRTFDIYSNSLTEPMFRNYRPSQLTVVSTYQNGQFLPGGVSFFTLRKTANSILPPLINAFELYSKVPMVNFITAPDDVGYMKEIKSHYSLRRIKWNGDPCSPKEYSWDGLICDYTSNPNPRIIEIDLSKSRLRGGLSLAFMNMASLKKLDLSHNNLTGTIPDIQLKSIEVLDLSNNQLNGPIPISIIQRVQANLLTLRLEGNPICSTVRDTYCSNKKKSNMTLLIAVIVPVVLVSLLVLMFILWKFCWKGKSEEHEDYAMYEEETPLHIDIRRFTYADLKLITNDFQTVIGKGGFGIVYHGVLENGEEVAVKVLMETSISESTDFLPEVQTLSKVHHKNLVTLEGYCQNKKCLALVYDYMPRGNLQEILRGGNYVLSWEERLRIALDSAQGLEYLHEACTPSIVHRDVKTPNILLDKNLGGIISDFGLSRAFNDAHTHISTVAAGTLGYLDPEYHATFQLTVKTDVYSFGIVLLEIVTGKPPVLMDPQTFHLPNWVRQKISKGSIHDIVDKTLSDQYDVDSLQTVVDLAMNCVESAAIDRPTMTEVVSRLKVCLPAVSSSKMSTASPKSKTDVDNEMARQFHLIVSGVSSISNEEMSFQSGNTSKMSEMSMFSGR